MESVLDLSLKDAAMLAVNQRLILQSVGWDVYEQVLRQFEDSNEVHIAYDDGFLEVEVPLFEHERAAEILRDLVTVICREKNLDYINAGSTTFRKRELAKGVEPDTCFYIQNESRIRGLKNVDLTKDPPPDLAIEVDLTSPSLNKLTIYAALGIPEVWVYRDDEVIFFKTFGGIYQETENSIAFPFLNNETVSSFLRSGFSEGSKKWSNKIREWVTDK
ncbi:MAG: Uma2 family endonuclease [Pyrinomonadaceae bacterium]